MKKLLGASVVMFTIILALVLLQGSYAQNATS